MGADTRSGRFFLASKMIGGITGAGLAASALDSSDGGYLALAPGVDVSKSTSLLD